MMGFGSYGNGNGGSYLSSPSSNLSASAPPFTIDRSGPKPVSCSLVDLTEPSSYANPMNSSLHNWLPSRSPTSEPKFYSSPNRELNSVPPSNAYGYSLQTVEFPNSNTHLPHLGTNVSGAGTGFVEAEPYYPSYLSPAAHKDGTLVIPDQNSYDWLSTSHVAALDGSSNIDYSQKPLDSKYAGPWGGLWNGFAEWKQGKQGQLDGSLCSTKTDVPVPSMHENYMTLEAYILKGVNRGNEASHGINKLEMEKHCGSVNTENSDDRSFSGKTSNFVPVDYSRSILEYLPGTPNTHLESPSFIFGTSSGNHQIPYSASNEKHLKQPADDSISIVKSSPSLVIGPPAIGSVSSAPNCAPGKSLNLGSDVTDTDMCSRKAYSTVDSHSQPISEHQLVFDSSQLSIHLGRDDPISIKSFSRKKEKTLNKACASNDTLHNMLKAKSGVQASNISHDGFNLDLNVNESIHSIEDSSESVDHYNHGVDSPCWKGVPVTRPSPFDASEVVPEMKKLEVCTYSNVQAKQIFPLNSDDKVTSQKPIKNLVSHEFGCMETGSEFPSNISSISNSAFRKQLFEDLVRGGWPSETKAIPRSDDNHEHGSRSTGCSDFKNFQITKQSLQGDESPSETINGTMQYVSSPLHLHSHFPVEHIVSAHVNETMPNVSPLSHLSFTFEHAASPSVEDATSKLTKSNEGSPFPTIDVLMLVSTIRNLSELLLFHCTSGSYQLKQKDLEAVQSVINNLNVCMSKNPEKMAPTGESTSKKDTSDYLGELNDLHEGGTVDRLQLTKTTGISFQALSANENIHKGNKSYMSSKKDDEILDTISVKGDLNILDEDKATQAFKKVLTENFHDEDEEETLTQAILYKNLWLEAEAALCSINYKSRFNRMKMEMEKLKSPNSRVARENTITTDMNKLTSSDVSPNPNVVETLSPKANACLTTKCQEPSFSSTSSENDDMMARFNILKCRIESSTTAATVDKPTSNAKVSPDSIKVDKILAEANDEKNDSPKPDIAIGASSNASTSNPKNNFETSVMARFHILKSRADNLSPHSTEGRLLPETVNLGYASKRKYSPIIGPGSEVTSRDVKPETTILQHQAADSTEGQLIGSELQMLVDDDPPVQTQRTNRLEDWLIPGWYDKISSMSSDWEHVRKEELGFQNR